MKKIIFIFLIIITFKSYSQISYNPCYDPDWDWTIPENWQVYFPENLLPDGTYLGVTNYPFIETEMNRDFRIILENNDLSPNDGWVLLQKNLGCETYATAKPYVVFYNYYRGLIRIFALHTYNESSSYGLMTVDWANSNRSSALTYSNIYSRANDKYPAYSNDMAMLQVENYAKNQWWVAEFQVAFDHKTNSLQTGYNLNIRVYNVINSELEFTSKIDLSSKSLEIKGEKDKKKGSNTNNTREWAVKGQKAIQKLSYDEWDDYLKKSKEGILEVNDWSINQWVENNTFGWLIDASAWTYDVVNNKTLGNILMGGAKTLGKVNSTLGFVVDLIDFFVGKPSKSSNSNSLQFSPLLQLAGTITSNGTLSTSTQQYNYTLPLPGTNVNYPYYTCPLGVLNLKETPSISLRKWTENKRQIGNFKKTNIWSHYSPYDGWRSVLFCDENSPFSPCNNWLKTNVYIYNSFRYKKENWKSIKLNDNIKLSINAGANLELVDAKIALQGKIKRKSQDSQALEYNIPTYNLFEKYDFIPIDISENDKIVDYSKYNLCLYDASSIDIYYYLENSSVLNNRWINKSFDYLKSKKYFLIEGGEKLDENKRNEFYKFRTEFVDIEHAKNLSFTVREETDVTLKIIATFKEINNDEAPLMVFTNEYILDEPETESDAIDTPYPFIRDQLSSVDIYQGSNEYIKIKNINISSGTFKKGKIETEGNVNINPSSNINFTANHSIILKPGFSTSYCNDFSFTAKIENDVNIINSTETPLNEIVTYYKDGYEYSYPVLCDCKPNFLSLKKGNTINQKNQKETLSTICNVFPNPCNGILNMDFYSDFKGVSKTYIYDINGKIVFQKDISSGFYRFDLTRLIKGIYLIKIINKSEVVTRKIIIN